MARDTIFALSSGRGVSAVAVIRISGPRAGEALQILAGRMPALRTAAFATLRTIEKEEIDEALVLWFPGPNSETGEDIAELQIHGGRAVIAAALAALGRLPNFRHAEAGEFTRRAFEHGQLDLTLVEALADLIGAETEAQRRQAYRQLKGLLGDRAETWRARLIEALALVEARIDFSDEADVPEDLIGPALKIAAELDAEIAAALAGAARGERLRDGLVVAIAGPPNAGKSTLLNRIARREAAIVSPIPGTTRDVIEVHLDLGGYPVTVLDTAGMRDSVDPIEQEGVRRATERAAAADLVLWVEDVTAPGSEAVPASQAPATWLIKNKIDLDLKIKEQDILHESNPSSMVFYISSKSEYGFNSLLNRLEAQAASFFGTEPALVSRERQRYMLQATSQALQRALAEGERGREDIIAEEFRTAATMLGRLTGRVDVEDVLDVIFRDFCIGK
jgi:tRNA modification GTPase